MKDKKYLIEYNREQNAWHLTDVEEERGNVHHGWKILAEEPLSATEAGKKIDRLRDIMKRIPVIFRKNGHRETDGCPICGSTHLHGVLGGTRSPHCSDESLKRVGKNSKELPYSYLIFNYL